jgi:hypothetical protein
MDLGVDADGNILCGLCDLGVRKRFAPCPQRDGLNISHAEPTEITEEWIWVSMPTEIFSVASVILV